MADLLHHYPAGFGRDRRVNPDVPARIYWAVWGGLAAMALAGFVYAVGQPVPVAMFDPNLLSPPVLPVVPVL